jgi:hypothetical protein
MGGHLLHRIGQGIAPYRVAIKASQHIESATSVSNNSQASNSELATSLKEDDMLKTLSAAALAFMFSGSAEAAKQRPYIEPAKVNTRTIGSCELYDPEMRDWHPNMLSPLGAIGYYVQSYQKAFLQELKPDDYSVKYIEQPKNGIINSVVEEGWLRDYYVPLNGFKGNDRYVAEVTVKGVKFKVVGYIRPSADIMSVYDDLCRGLGLPSSAWKIADAADKTKR